MATEILSVGIEKLDDGYFRWVVRREKPSPVKSLFRSCYSFPTRVDAIADFQATCKIIDWEGMVSEVPIHR